MFNLGAKPLSHPIRTRAWHRAHRRGDLWIILPYKAFKDVGGTEDGSSCCTFKGNKYKQVHFDSNCPMDTGYITWPF